MVSGIQKQFRKVKIELRITKLTFNWKHPLEIPKVLVQIAKQKLFTWSRRISFAVQKVYFAKCSQVEVLKEVLAIAKLNMQFFKMTDQTDVCRNLWSLHGGPNYRIHVLMLGCEINEKQRKTRKYKMIFCFNLPVQNFILSICFAPHRAGGFLLETLSDPLFFDQNELWFQLRPSGKLGNLPRESVKGSVWFQLWASSKLEHKSHRLKSFSPKPNLPHFSWIIRSHPTTHIFVFFIFPTCWILLNWKRNSFNLQTCWMLGNWSASDDPNLLRLFFKTSENDSLRTSEILPNNLGYQKKLTHNQKTIIKRWSLFPVPWLFGIPRIPQKKCLIEKKMFFFLNQCLTLLPWKKICQLCGVAFVSAIRISEEHFIFLTRQTQREQNEIQKSSRHRFGWITNKQKFIDLFATNVLCIFRALSFSCFGPCPYLAKK